MIIRKEISYIGGNACQYNLIYTRHVLFYIGLCDQCSVVRNHLMRMHGQQNTRQQIQPERFFKNMEYLYLGIWNVFIRNVVYIYYLPGNERHGFIFLLGHTFWLLIAVFWPNGAFP